MFCVITWYLRLWVFYFSLSTDFTLNKRFFHRWREVLSNTKCEGVSPMRRLIERFPDVAKVRLFIISLWTPDRLASNFSLQYHPWIIHQGQKNERNDRQRKKLLNVKQILSVSSIGNGYQEQHGEYAFWCYGVRGQKRVKKYDVYGKAKLASNNCDFTLFSWILNQVSKNWRK